MQQPTQAQIKALKTFAKENGRNWKAQLIEYWANSSHLQCDLAQVRNQFGVQWLLKFKLNPSKPKKATKLTTLKLNEEELYIVQAALNQFANKTSDDIQAKYKEYSDKGQNIPSDLIAANSKYTANVYRVQTTVNQKADEVYKAAFDRHQQGA